MTVKRTIFNQIIKAIENSDRILVAGHADPDGDSIGSQLAFSNFVGSLAKKAVLINDGVIGYRYSFLPNTDQINNTAQFQCDYKFDLAIVLDCSNIERTGDVTKLIDKKTRIINIDHHPDNIMFGDLNIVNSKSSSVGEILADHLFDINYKMDKDTAIMLYTAIITDTGRFRFESTGRRTMEIAGRLIECGVNSRDISDKIYYSIPPDILRLTGILLTDMEFFEHDKICIMHIRQKAFDKFHTGLVDMEGLADYALSAKNVVVGGFLKERTEKNIKVSLRSRNGIDVSALAHKYGGGGHSKASGFVVNLSLGKAKEKVLNDLRELVNESL